MIKHYGTEKSSVVVFWQEPKADDVMIGEPAISMKAYSDCLCLKQGDRGSINITLECVPEFLKAVKQAMAGE